MRQNLGYFWRINLAVLLGAAVATAVLTGALLVGDSVRGSLRDLTLDRLGQIDDALVGERFFRETLGEELAATAIFQKEYRALQPAILLSGAAIHAQSKARASQINIVGLDERFTKLFPPLAGKVLTASLEKTSAQIFPSLVINASLQKELGAAVGDQVLLSLERQSDIHRESLFGSKKNDEVIRTVRLTVTRVIPDEGVGRFGLRPRQHLPLNAYVSLAVLQKALEQRNRVNALFAERREGTDSTQALQTALQQVLTLEEAGLILRQDKDIVSLESREFVLPPDMASLALNVAEELRAPTLPLLTYLATAMIFGDRRTPYSTVTALEVADVEPLGELVLQDGSPAPPLGDDGILLNDWTARDLAAAVGDTLTMTYYAVGLREAVLTRQHRFVVRGIVRMTGLAADPRLTPDFPGIHDADNIYDWDPPFPVDLSRVRPKDESYWDNYRATPKAFVSLQTGQRLWQSRFGELTAIRFAAAPNRSLAETRQKFTGLLQERISPPRGGYVFQPVKAQGIRAASGATDFSGLFIGFSMFLIVSAALLVGLLFRLGVEQRVSEIGLLLATGYSIRQVRRQFLKEGGLLAGLGGLLGIGLAILYAWLLMVALRTLWVEATGTTFLYLHLQPLSLLLGYALAMGVVLFSIWLTVRKLRQIPAVALLAGETTPSGQKQPGSGRKARIASLVAFAAALLLISIAVATGKTASAGLFFASGALLLIASLSFVAAWFRRFRTESTGSSTAGLGSTITMAARNNARKPGRSMLCIALVACACFMIVSVGANRKDYRGDAVGKISGVGGYSLLAESEIPLLHNLNTREGRFELGFSDKAAAALDSTRVMPFRLLPGEDASCLNLYQPEKPRVLGVPAEQLRRGGFSFQAVLDDREDNPWKLLEKELEAGVIPAIGDYNSVMWILHSGLGRDIVIPNETGKTVRLRLVGLLSTSIFQSEVLISETQFLKHFPNQSGYSYFLIDAPASQREEVTETLERTLRDYGFDVVSTTEKLAEYQAVENTYLSVFQTLGGLGLLLGTLGLGIVLFRNVLERRGEFATMRAFGYRRNTLGKMLLTENSLLIGWGIAIGSATALIAVIPQIVSRFGELPWTSLAVTLLIVLGVGVAVSAAAVSAALRIPLLPALKAE